MLEQLNENSITHGIIGAIFDTYNALGPGLLESVYEEVMTIILREKGYEVKTQQTVPITFNDKILSSTLRLDLIVNDSVIVEIKSVAGLQDVHYKQLLTYLRLTNKHVGLLVNFNTANISDSFHRVINPLYTPSAAHPGKG